MLHASDIHNAHLVTDHFTTWPSFHDAEVIRLTLYRNVQNVPSAELLIHAWTTTSQIDEHGYYVQEKHALITLLFRDLIASTFTDFNHQNVLFSLQIERTTTPDNHPAFEVAFDSSYGLTGSLLCRHIEVTALTPCNNRGEPQSGAAASVG